jgi:hypothetical protein
MVYFDVTVYPDDRFRGMLPEIVVPLFNYTRFHWFGPFFLNHCHMIPYLPTQLPQVNFFVLMKLVPGGSLVPSCCLENE